MPQLSWAQGGLSHWGRSCPCTGDIYMGRLPAAGLVLAAYWRESREWWKILEWINPRNTNAASRFGSERTEFEVGRGSRLCLRLLGFILHCLVDFSLTGSHTELLDTWGKMPGGTAKEKNHVEIMWCDPDKIALHSFVSRGFTGVLWWCEGLQALPLS